MSRSSRFSITLILAATLPLSAADEPTKSVAVDDSMARVLKTELFALAEQLGDNSEAGQDHAARMLAAARRIQTEARISTNSMQRVLVLAGWREALNRWDDLELEIVSLQSGGGTMWSHMMQRNDAETEEFLDSIADHLPLEEAELKPETARAIDDLLKGAKKWLALAKADAGKAGLKPEHQATDLARRLGEARERLKWQFRFAGDADATKRLLARCSEAASAWDAINKTEKKRRRLKTNNGFYYGLSALAFPLAQHVRKSLGSDREQIVQRASNDLGQKVCFRIIDAAKLGLDF